MPPQAANPTTAGMVLTACCAQPCAIVPTGLAHSVPTAVTQFPESDKLLVREQRPYGKQGSHTMLQGVGCACAKQLRLTHHGGFVRLLGREQIPQAKSRSADLAVNPHLLDSGRGDDLPRARTSLLIETDCRRVPFEEFRNLRPSPAEGRTGHDNATAEDDRQEHEYPDTTGLHHRRSLVVHAQ